MKTKNLISVLAFLIGTTIATYGQKYNSKTETKVTEAKTDSSDYIKFKTANEKKIKENEKKIADLKVKLAKEKQEARDRYNQKVADIEKKNQDLRKRIEEYKEEDKDKSKWEEFKREFNHDMDELSRALKDLAVDNTK